MTIIKGHEKYVIENIEKWEYPSLMEKCGHVSDFSEVVEVYLK